MPQNDRYVIMKGDGADHTHWILSFQGKFSGLEDAKSPFGPVTSLILISGTTNAFLSWVSWHWKQIPEIIH